MFLGDPFWEKAETLFLQSILYYVIRHYDEKHRNFETVLNLIRLSNQDASGISPLDRLFDKWAKDEPDAVGVKQYKHFKIAAAAPKMLSTIILVSTTRIAAFNIKEVANLTNSDDMELERIGMPIDDDSSLLKEIREKTGKNIGNGKIAYFIITTPADGAFNFLANMFYTQIFTRIDENSKLCGGSLHTHLDMYMDEWAQLGEIPRFVEELAYVRGLNVGIVIRNTVA